MFYDRKTLMWRVFIILYVLRTNGFYFHCLSTLYQYPILRRWIYQALIYLTNRVVSLVRTRHENDMLEENDRDQSQNEAHKAHKALDKSNCGCDVYNDFLVID